MGGRGASLKSGSGSKTISNILDKIDKLPKIQHKIGDIKNVFPVVSLEYALQGTPDKFNPYDESVQKDAYVNVSELKTVQSYVTSSNLKTLAKALQTTKFEDLYDPDYPTDTAIIVLHNNNDYIVYDGNHRATLAKIIGKDKIKVKLVEIK